MRWCLAAAWLAACGGQARDGVWEYADETIAENSCGPAADEYEGASGEFTIEWTGEDTFEVDPLDGTDPFTCTATGKDFVCPERLAEALEAGGGRAEVKASAEGTFSSSKKAKGTQRATLNCLDDTCRGLLALAGVTTPCTLAVDFEAAWVEPL